MRFAFEERLTVKPEPLDFIFSSPRGCSSVVERDLAKVEVEGSNPFTRFLLPVQPCPQKL